MIAAANRNGVKLQIGFMRRYDESFVEAKKRIESGEIGDVVLVSSHTRGPSVPSLGCMIFKKAMVPWPK